MKAIWKVLIGAAAVAAVTPYKVEKNEETGAVKLTSATWAATYIKGPEGPNITVKLLPALSKDDDDECEDECCCCGEEDESGDGITIDVEDAAEAPAEEPAGEPAPEAE